MTSTLQETWKTLFQTRLPAAARSKDPSQRHWPVHVDHCFARIILDKVVGEGIEPWIGKIKSPAYKHMSSEQLRAAIKLGEEILEGKADLVDLDRSSLVSRGKAVKKGAAVVKRKREGRGKVVVPKKRTRIREGDQSQAREDGPAKNEIYESGSDEFPKSEHADSDMEEQEDDEAAQTDVVENKTADTSTKDDLSKTKESQDDILAKYFLEQPNGKRPLAATILPVNVAQANSLLQKISDCSKTDFQKQVLGLLIQIPSGRFSTYGHLSKYLNSSPRAVGNALRNNPFAPEVPCHRVLATGGGIGGFGGSWGKGGQAGKNDQEKRRLLKAEGISFDAKDKAIGKPFTEFYGYGS